MTDLEAVLTAAERTKARLIQFADGPVIHGEDYRSVVQDIGAFGTFISELTRVLSGVYPAAPDTADLGDELAREGQASGMNPKGGPA